MVLGISGRPALYHEATSLPLKYAALGRSHGHIQPSSFCLCVCLQLHNLVVLRSAFCQTSMVLAMQLLQG
jgi:hypothetical protein